MESNPKSVVATTKNTVFLTLRKIFWSMIPRGSMLGRMAVMAWYRCTAPHLYKDIVKYNRAVRPLLDIDVLNKRIEDVKKLAESDDSSKKFYIIVRDGPNAGLFTHVTLSFAHILYALAEGMIPVIDMQSYSYFCLEKDKIGKENAWEYFFKHPCGYGLNDVEDCDCVYSNRLVTENILPVFLFGKKDKLYYDHFQLWFAVYRHFFSFKDEVAQYAEEEYNKIIKPGMRVMGVYCRGTDYSGLRPRSHHIQPTVSDVIAKVKTKMREWNCDYIYITADEKKTIEQFESAFPNKVLSISREYYDDVDYSKYETVVEFQRENDMYRRSLEYLASVIIFTRCNSAILGLCSGSMAGVYINGGKFENTYIFDLGIY